MNISTISDKYGNRKRVSNISDSLNLTLNVSDNTKRISNKPGSMNSILSVSNSKIFTPDNKNKSPNISDDKELHSCIRNISSCQEKYDNTLWLYIGTYKSKVNFCPYCGYKSK